MDPGTFTPAFTVIDTLGLAKPAVGRRLLGVVRTGNGVNGEWMGVGQDQGHSQERLGQCHAQNWSPGMRPLQFRDGENEAWGG